MIKTYLLPLLLTITLQAAAMEGRGCVTDSGNEYLDKITAKAVAKGQLSHEIGSQVEAKTQLKTITIENENVIKVEDKLTETITIKSKHKINRVNTIESNYLVIDGIKKYCVTVQIK